MLKYKCVLWEIQPMIVELHNVRSSASSSLAICIIVICVFGPNVENPHRLVLTTEQYCISAMYINLRYIMN